MLFLAFYPLFQSAWLQRLLPGGRPLRFGLILPFESEPHSARQQIILYFVLHFGGKPADQAEPILFPLVILSNKAKRLTRSLHGIGGVRRVDGPSSGVEA